MRVRVARRYQVTIPEEIREEIGINVGDTVDVTTQGGKVVIQKVGRDWDDVMRETRGTWKSHPAFGGLNDSVEITHWLRNKRKSKS